MLGDEIKFDIDRLANEVDEVFQEKYAKGQQLLQGHLTKFDKQLQDNVEVYRKQVGKVIEANLELVLQEMQKGRSTIQINGGDPIVIGQMDHPQTEAVIKSLVAHKKILLVGPAG